MINKMEDFIAESHSQNLKQAKIDTFINEKAMKLQKIIIIDLEMYYIMFNNIKNNKYERNVIFQAFNFIYVYVLKNNWK